MQSAYGPFAIYPQRMESSSNNSTSKDWQGLGDLVELAADRLTKPVKDTHHAIADRWASLAGPLAQPARRASRAVTTPIYESIRLTGLGIGRALSFVASTEAASSVLHPLWESQRGSGIQAFFNGLWGDELDRQGSNLSIELSLRGPDGDVIRPDKAVLTEAFPHARGRLVVLLHGLGDTERAWHRTEQKDTLPRTLTIESFTPLMIRYNSGLEIAKNGELLSNFIEQLVAAWPVPVDEISLIGHSMGGLVARNALLAASSDQGWTTKARHIVTVGSPHLGAPLEKGVKLAATGLNQTPESRPIGEFLDQRSAGIKDLGFGSDGDSVDRHPGVELHFVAGAITAEADNIFGRIVGDLIVPVASATGLSRNKSVSSHSVRVMGGRNHRALLHDQVIHREMVGWLTANQP